MNYSSIFHEETDLDKKYSQLKQQKCFDVVVTIDSILDIKKVTSIWAYDIEDAKNKAYFKWPDADKREVTENAWNNK
jgi:hypothetical protein